MIIIMRDLAEAQHFNFLGSHRYYYSNYEKKEIDSKDYINFVRNYFTNEYYNLFFKNPWTYISFNGNEIVANGWKIHISATINNHIQILNIVAKYSIANKIDFKFAINKEQFIYINNKNIARASSGKFIVIYPSEEKFDEVIESLYLLLKDYNGPYILSDRPYKESKVLYYRYGEIRPITDVDEYGTIKTFMINDNNEKVIDRRTPYFYLPHYVKDKVYKESDSTKSLLLEKYDIMESLYFSSQGGVYKGLNDGREYVIKEARAYTGIDDSLSYSTDRLRKEFEILKFLGGIDCIPICYELIEECENVYLVEEFIDGKTLYRYGLDNSPLIRMRNKINENNKVFVEEFLDIIKLLLKGISQIHARGVMLNDISANNIIYDKDRKRLKIIDYEVAYHIIDKYNKTDLFTPGFTSDKGYTPIQEELHKIGLVLISCIIPINHIFLLIPEKKNEIMKRIYKYDILPSNIVDTIDGLINYRFNTAEEAVENIEFCRPNMNMNMNYEIGRFEIKKQEIDILTKHINKNIMEYHEMEKINPLAIDPMGIMTNKYCFAFGEFGILYALSKMGKLDDRILNSVVNNFMTSFYRNSNFSSGLFVGISGIAFSLLELGYIKEAEVIMNDVIKSENSMSDLAYGLSGIIITLLRFHKYTNDSKYLSEATKKAELLISRSVMIDGFYSWSDVEKDIYTGLTRGSSGIALAFLYLYFETNNKLYLKWGLISIENDINELKFNTDGYICFNGIPKGTRELSEIYSPYIHNGIAGVGIVLLRYFLVTRDKKYLSLIDSIIEASSSDMTLFPGYLRGMSGIMTFLQDCVIYLNSAKAREALDNMTENIQFFRVETDGIVGYAGDELFRISNDLFTGTSGVALMLNRYLNLSNKPYNPFLPLDNYYHEMYLGNN